MKRALRKSLRSGQTVDRRDLSHAFTISEELCNPSALTSELSPTTLLAYDSAHQVRQPRLSAEKLTSNGAETHKKNLKFSMMDSASDVEPSQQPWMSDTSFDQPDLRPDSVVQIPNSYRKDESCLLQSTMNYISTDPGPASFEGSKSLDSSALVTAPV